MMKISDSIVLAGTKLKIRKVRLTIGLAIISILASLILLSVLTVLKSSESLEDFSNQGLNGRYIVAVAQKKPIPNVEDLPTEYVHKAETLYQQKAANDKLEAKKNGVDYVENPNDNPISQLETYKKVLQGGSEITWQVFQEYMRKEFPDTSQENVRAVAKEYQAQNFFVSTDMISRGDSMFIPITNGKESAKDITQSGGMSGFMAYFNYLAMVDQDLAENFISRNYKLEKNEIPVIVNYKIAEQILGLKSLEKSATDQEKYDRIQLLRSKVPKMSQDVCWRNLSSRLNYDDAISANKDAYSKVKYNLPEQACGAPTIKTDERSAEERQAENAALKVWGKSDRLVDPVAKIIRFKVVGLMPTRSETFFDENIENLIEKISSSTLDTGVSMVPRAMFNKNVDNALASEILSVRDDIAAAEFGTEYYIIEFNTADEMRKFIADNNCEKDYCGTEFSMSIQPFSNNAAVISDVKKIAENAIFWTILAVSAITILLIYSIVNRILSDSRQETAVFRAIGYSRFEISQIYISYIAIFTAISTIIITTLTFTGTTIMKSVFEPTASLYFTNFFVLESPKSFDLIEFSPLVPAIFAPIFLIGIISSLIPLIINTRRSPLKNLRSG
jgi:hypothetical protein